MALAGDTKVNDEVGYANKDKIALVPKSAIHALTTPPLINRRASRD
jgi:hypothetical protein